MKVQDLIAQLQKMVNENPEVANYEVYNPISLESEMKISNIYFGNKNGNEDANDFDIIWFAESELPKDYNAAIGGDLICGTDINNYVFINKTLSEIEDIKQEATDLKNILNSIGLVTLSEFDFFHQELVL